MAQGARQAREDADKPVIEWLKAHGKLVKRENYLHSYPFCYRTGAPLIYRAMSCWFVDVPKIKDIMISCNEEGSLPHQARPFRQVA